MSASLLNYEKLLRDVEEDIQNAKKQKIETFVHSYEKEEDDYTNVPLTNHQQEDDYYEKVSNRTKDEDDIELDEAELKAYLNLQKAQKLLQKRETPNELASVLLRSNEKINKTDGIMKKMEEIQLSKYLPWIHTLTLHSFKPLEVVDFDNDLERELAFYNQALLSANEAINRLSRQNIPCIRPDDYFAEMIKSDEHMMKIQNKLLHSKKVIEEREARRKMKEQKKLGKKIQISKLQEKLEEKKANLEAIKLWKKKSTGKEFDINDLEKNIEEVKQMNTAKRAKIKQQPTQKDKKSSKGNKSTAAKGTSRGIQKQKSKRLGKNRRAEKRAKKK
jgi:rRNA-processing protein EBP2